jgi:dipeptidyl aminopeptidase/acylaminoacyl peptidase
MMIKFQFTLAITMVAMMGCATANKEKVTRSYLDWEPVIQPEEVFRSAIGFSFVQTDGENAYWVELRPDEGGRNVLMQADSSGKVRELTPREFNVRTRVFEYGSDPYVVRGNWVYFTNFKDQRLYKQDLKNLSSIIALTPATNLDGTLGKYAELEVSLDGRWLVFAYEKEGKTGHPSNHVGLIDLQMSGEQEAKILTQGADFYKKPTFSPDGSKLAWLEWKHPYMQWDSTRLYLAPFKTGELKIKQRQLVAGSDHSAIWDIQFLIDGELAYSEDLAGERGHSPKNFANIYSYKDSARRTLTSEPREFHSLRSAGKNLLSLAIEKGESRIVLVSSDATTKTLEVGDYVDFGFPVSATDGTIFVVALSGDRPAEFIAIEPSGKIKVLRKAADFPIHKEDVSVAERIEFPTLDGKISYGYFYPPVNSRFKAKEGENPPVRVLVHGGPTSMTSRAFYLSKMFWTSQGFAIFDVNYRGSIGFGREYRDALKKKWGLLEIQDVKDGLAFLMKSGRVSGKSVISGGSAGGYTVQRVLTYYPELFAAGSSHFGIGNLVTLQKLTHKFEAHYLEQLIGGTLENNLKEYEARSPINHLSNLKAPMIIFQGTEDKVVPPENSREMAEILKKKGIPYEYYEYPDEGHGFRKKENLIATITREASFFKRVLSK